MLETDFATKFATWFNENRNKFSDKVVFEYKCTNGNTYNLKNWLAKQPHQMRSLTHAQNDVGVYHKISDQSSGQKPVDAFFIANADSFLVIYFSIQKRFFVLPYDYLTTKIQQTSVSYKELSEALESYKLIPKIKKEILEF